MINYKILDESQRYYGALGYVPIESPWTVSKAVSDITRPENLDPYELTHNKKCLVGSGEQSFIYMMTKGFLPEGRYQTITPCFRDEAFDTMHLKYFMKNELINTLSVSQGALEGMVDQALRFFKKYLPEADILRYADGTFDIVWKEFELGSYGIREHHQLSWIYGTGVAEPRLSHLFKIYHGLSQQKDTKREGRRVQ